MNIEKVKDALEDCAELYVLADGIQSFEDFEGGQPSLGTLKNLQIIKESAIKAKSALAELENPGEEALYKNLYQAARSCILNKYPYEDESGIIKLQLGNYAKLKSAYDAINKTLPEPPHV